MLRIRNVVLFLISVFVLIFFALPIRADDKAKDEQTLKNATAILESMVSDKSISQDLLNKADCVIILPSVKKFAVGVGGSGGRGAMSCRQGRTFCFGCFQA